MHHYTFHLKPDLQVLYNHGYAYDISSQSQLDAFKKKSDGVIHESNYLNEAEGIHITQIFTGIVNDFNERYPANRINNADTLLYVALREYEVSRITLDSFTDNIPSKNRAVELAKLLLMYDDLNSSSWDKNMLQTMSIAFRPPKGKTVLIKDKLLLKWIGELIIKGFESFDFPIKFGEYVQQMRLTTDLPPLQRQKLNRSKLQAIINLKKSKRVNFDAVVLNYFAYTIMAFLKQNNPNPSKTKYSQAHLLLIFDITQLFGLLPALETDRFNAEKANLIRAAITNHIRDHKP